MWFYLGVYINEHSVLEANTLEDNRDVDKLAELSNELTLDTEAMEIEGNTLKGIANDLLKLKNINLF